MFLLPRQRRIVKLKQSYIHCMKEYGMEDRTWLESSQYWCLMPINNQSNRTYKPNSIIFGLQLWKYSKNDVNAFYIKWSKVVFRRIWKIPNTTRCNLLPAINKSLPIEFLMEKRCAKFIWSCSNSHNLIVRNISMAAKISSFSHWNKYPCRFINKVN